MTVHLPRHPPLRLSKCCLPRPSNLQTSPQLHPLQQPCSPSWGVREPFLLLNLCRYRSQPSLVFHVSPRERRNGVPRLSNRTWLLPRTPYHVLTFALKEPSCSELRNDLLGLCSRRLSKHDGQSNLDPARRFRSSSTALRSYHKTSHPPCFHWYTEYKVHDSI